MNISAHLKWKLYRDVLASGAKRHILSDHTAKVSEQVNAPLPVA